MYSSSPPSPTEGTFFSPHTLLEKKCRGERHALAITGSIDLPEFHETITAQNMLDRIHYYQVGPGKQANYLPASPGIAPSGQKRFTEVLAAHFLARIRQLSSRELPKFLQLLIDSLHSKDVQIFFNPEGAEHLLQSYHPGASIQSPGGDGLFVVDANIGADKANSLITSTLNDQITVDGQGNVVHRTTLHYAWTQQGQTYGSPSTVITCAFMFLRAVSY